MMESAFGIDHGEVSKALAQPMTKMPKLTKPRQPMGGGMAGGAPKPPGAAAGNPMLRQVNRLTQGASAPVGNRPMGGLQSRLKQRGQNVRNNAPKAGQALRSRLGQR